MQIFSLPASVCLVKNFLNFLWLCNFRVLKEGINKVQKAFSRSSTPSGTRTSTVEFSSPSVVPSAKRRANDFTTSASPTKQTKSTFETAYTPRGARNRSISIRSRLISQTVSDDSNCYYFWFPLHCFNMRNFNGESYKRFKTVLQS